jgi:hypothetical protein
MRNLVLIVALGLAVAFTATAFAGDNEADCQKAGGTWDAKTKLAQTNISLGISSRELGWGLI